MSQTYDGDVNNNGEKVKVCRIDLEIVDTSKLIKPCRVMLERKKSREHENHEQEKVCRIALERIATSQLIKPCRVMLERKKSLVHENQAGHHFYHVMSQKLHVKPKTIRQRMENEQLLQLYHHGHQDDIFDSISPIKNRPLLSDSSVMSDSNQSPLASSGSSIGPIQSWPVLATSTPKKDERLSVPFSLVSDPCQYQHCAYIHKKLKEKKPREINKKRIQVLYEKGNFDNLVELVKENVDGGVMNEVTECESYFSFE